MSVIIDNPIKYWLDVSFPQSQLDHVLKLYEKYNEDLEAVKEKMAIFYSLRNSIGLFPQLGDFEAEITYLKIREQKPEIVVEISPASGWSTSWILHALKDNNYGVLYSYDIVEDSTRIVPDRISSNRWKFFLGDIRNNLAALPKVADYIFIDSDHSAEFAQWYIDTIFPLYKKGTPVSAHDIIKLPTEPGYGEESIVLCKWLIANNKDCFTAARQLKDKGYHKISALRTKLGSRNIEPADYNSMIFFTL